MNEVNSPERKIEGQEIKHSPEQLRAEEASKFKMEDDLEAAGFNIENPEKKENPEREFTCGNQMEASLKSTDKQRENKLDSMNSEEETNKHPYTEVHKASDKTEKPETKVDRESEHWQKHGEMCKSAYENSSAKVEKDIRGNNYKELNQQEKQKLSSEMKNHIDSIPKGERGNYRVPEPEKIKGVTQTPDGRVRLVEAWKPGTDGAKEGTRRMETVTVKDENGNPNYIDRIGSSNGNYFSPMKEDGSPYSLRERAIGDYLPEKKLEDNDSYHKYEIKQDFTRENFEKAIDRTYSDPDLNAKKHRELDKYYKDAVSADDTNGHDGESYKYNGEHPNGVKSGEIDNMFGTEENPDGGGRQYITPFSAEELEKMGMIEEIKKEEQ